MIKINKFKNGKNAYVTESVTIDDVLSTIKYGDDNLEKINAIRNMGKQNLLFDDNKMSLPSFRFNFLFNKKANNLNIIEPTGFIYIDIDACDIIDNTNNYIYASWKSISETGFGVLVKVSGLTKDNYSDTYNAISIELGLSSDVGARKATQQTILSFDPNIYINEDSLTFKAVNQKVTSSTIQEREKRKKLIEVDVTFNNSDDIRFNNISDYFIDNDSDYIVFEEGEKLCIPFIPKRIEAGNRNKIMFGVLTQIALLNPEVGAKFLISIANTINIRFVVKYSDDKISGIVGAVLTKRENKTLEPYFNKERKLIFNPKVKMTKIEKQKIIGKEMGKIKTNKTRNEIYSVIENWDFEINGNITQVKVAELLSKNVRTIKRNWDEFKEYVKELNSDATTTIPTQPIPTPQEEEIVSEIEDMDKEKALAEWMRETYERKMKKIETYKTN